MAEDENTEVIDETKNHRLVLARDGFEGELIYERRGTQLFVGPYRSARRAGREGSWKSFGPSCRHVGRAGESDHRPLVSLCTAVAPAA